eukprot:CAMPEP_0184689394 /NCGR_PEP_ID=MMETSP0312-20130426/30631_1 /TAXON_ID=31354 /ORGANISM="Compsopogon coeruleus, Strain SAG 36.94" /LENGTH=130 /DNA_ID=CAMNT_0027146735 /DNA_START=480 /DNA_END=869 /DNA_ORIENTATION=-
MTLPATSAEETSACAPVAPPTMSAMYDKNNAMPVITEDSVKTLQPPLTPTLVAWISWTFSRDSKGASLNSTQPQLRPLLEPPELKRPLPPSRHLILHPALLVLHPADLRIRLRDHHLPEGWLRSPYLSPL